MGFLLEKNKKSCYNKYTRGLAGIGGAPLPPYPKIFLLKLTVCAHF